MIKGTFHHQPLDLALSSQKKTALKINFKQYLCIINNISSDTSYSKKTDFKKGKISRISNTEPLFCESILTCTKVLRMVRYTQIYNFQGTTRCLQASLNHMTPRPIIKLFNNLQIIHLFIYRSVNSLSYTQFDINDVCHCFTFQDRTNIFFLLRYNLLSSQSTSVANRDRGTPWEVQGETLPPGFILEHTVLFSTIP